MNLISVMIGKIIIIIGKLFGKGSSIPGAISLKISKKVLSYFKLPKIIVAVTGSSGKGSTSSLIAEVLRKNGYTVAHNIKGSNLTAGIVTLLLENSKLNGEIKTDALVFEIDERYTKEVFDVIKPKYVVITNITRDQPPRQGNYEMVALKIKSALKPNMHLILNGDDPFLQIFVMNNKVTYYGIEKNKYSYKVPKFKSLNLKYCPKCYKKLEYNYYHFEIDGDYYCSNCDFKRPNIDVKATRLNYEKEIMVIDNKYILSLQYNILFSVYNSLAAFTLLKCLGIEESKITTSINEINGNKKIMSCYNYQNREVTVLNNKNENSSTFNQSLLYISRMKDKKVIIIGWKEISRRYNFEDLSWLYDIDFELLKNLDIEKVICVGINRYDIACRIKYSDLESKVVTFETLTQATDYIKTKTKGNIYGILNFDYVKPFNNLMMESDET